MKRLRLPSVSLSSVSNSNRLTLPRTSTHNDRVSPSREDTDSMEGLVLHMSEKQDLPSERMCRRYICLSFWNAGLRHALTAWLRG